MSDGPQVYRDDIRRANKNHKCYECSSIISKGEKYHVFTGLWDDWSTFKTCDSCDSLRLEIDAEQRANRDEPICFGDLQENVFEGSNTDWMKRYIDNMIFRGTVVPDWMRESLQADKWNRGKTKFAAAMLKI